MDEEEYEEYMRAVFGLTEPEETPELLSAQLRDEYGHRVPGCYRVLPRPVEN